MGEEQFTVRKLNYEGRETWRWTGKVVERVDGVVVVDALFNAKSRDLGYMKLETNDLFHEYYYADKWFNIYQVFGSDGNMKGWYCNVTKPALFSENEVAFVDMVLDVFVYPDGRTLVLDEDEFNEKRKTVYSPEDVQLAEAAVAELLQMVRTRQHPFDEVGQGGAETGR
ncbi:MAG: DUF402 domain-containing protein [Chloroflexota bacterium]